MSLTDEFGTALVLITHDLCVVAGLADRVMVMYGGRCVERGPVDDLFYDPRHPYTLGLLHSTPNADVRAQRLDPIEGVPPNLEHLPSGCVFHPRCAFRFDRCFSQRPPLADIGGGRAKACWYEGRLAYEEVA
jgi:oligopeptide transport system ATP-binding protein